MSSALLFVTLLAQSVWAGHIPGQPSRTVVTTPLVLDLAPNPESAQSAQAASFQRHQFATRFNRLTQSLNEFADAYNEGTLDLKKIEEVKKAWRELEKAEALFRMEKSK
jgi:cell wall assembly regulator SMI1